MKTRRFKALNGAKGKYARIVEKIAIYDDNGKLFDCCVIQKDDDGREYYYPTNHYNKSGLFTGRPKDAIDCIRNGHGDALKVSKILGFNLESVVRYIDREYGEALRQKSIDGWKDTKFAYAIKFRYLNSFDDGALICKDKTLMGFGSTKEGILTFDSEKSAINFIKKVNKKARKYFNEYLALELTGQNSYDYNYIVSPFFDKIEGKIEHGMRSLYWKAFSGIKETGPDKGKAEYKMDVVQIIVS